MRGRSLLKESPAPSICAFCAHRLGAAARPPSHVQRRFLQSSHINRKPPAAAAALLDNTDSRPTRTSAPSWGSGNSATSTPSWGSQATPSWGSQTKTSGSAVSAPKWGSSNPSGSWGATPPPNPEADPETGASTQAQNTVPTQSTPVLLPHEQRAKELTMERAKRAQGRDVKIHAGPGPESTRGGRPEPMTQEEYLRIAQEKRLKKEAMDMDFQRKQNLGNVPRIRFHSSHTMGDPATDPKVIGSHTKDDTSSSPGSLKWAQLKRKIDVPPKLPPQDPFVAARAKREDQATLGLYTPLGHRSVSERGSYADRPRADMWSRGTTYSNRNNNETSNATAQPNFGSRGLQISGSNAALRTNNETSAQPNYLSRGFQIPGSQQRHTEPLTSSPSTVLGEVVKDLFKAPTEPSPPQAASSITDSHNTETPEAVPWRPVEDTERKAKLEEERPSEPEVRRKVSSRFEAADETPRHMHNYGSSHQHQANARPDYKMKNKSQRRRHYDAEDADDESMKAIEKAELRKQRKAEKQALKKAAPTPMLLPEYISVANLAVALKVKLDNFVEKMEELGFEETNHDYILNAEDAGLIAMEYNFEPIIERAESEDLHARPPPEDPTSLPPRSPVVTIMGHVDHGKTTILDYLRQSSIAASEHGGITQHIGAFSVPMLSGKIITFLDTPGHEAFLSMRQRGANVTDIVILVVAADDSVKPQTIEAINHAKAAKVPIIVAINKVDKEDINIDRVKQDLARNGVEIEDYGGDTQVICVSGKTGLGMDDLQEATTTLSEILDMRAETDGQAEGWVIEASIKSMGKVATVLIRRGTMRPGDFIVAGKTWARIRCLRNEAGVELTAAGPGTPVEIDGWREQPVAGDEVLQAPDEAKAKSVIEFRLEKEERDKLAEDMEAINEARKSENEKREREKAEKENQEVNDEEKVAPALPATTASGPKPVYFILKGDVSGSVEAVTDSIQAIGTKEVEPIILRSGVGQLSEFDIEHAATAKGCVINFNTPIEPRIARLAEESKVPIFDHNIIYRLVDEIRAELSKHLPPLISYKVLGEAEVSRVFDINVKGRKYKPVAGCKIRNGTISKNDRYRVLRGGEKVFDGTLESLKHLKKEVTEMKKGGECGMGFEKWSDFQVGDQIQAYEEIREKRYL